MYTVYLSLESIITYVLTLAHLRFVIDKINNYYVYVYYT